MEKYASMWRGETPVERQEHAVDMWNNMTGGSIAKEDTASRLEKLFPHSHTKTAFASPVAVLGEIAPGAYLGSTSGRDLSGHVAHGITPRGNKIKAKDIARKVGLPLAAVAAVLGALVTPGSHKVRGMLLRKTKLPPEKIKAIMKYAYPLLAGTAAGAAAGVATGAGVGGYYRMTTKKASLGNVRAKHLVGAASLLGGGALAARSLSRSRSDGRQALTPQYSIEKDSPEGKQVLTQYLNSGDTKGQRAVANQIAAHRHSLVQGDNHSALKDKVLESKKRYADAAAKHRYAAATAAGVGGAAIAGLAARAAARKYGLR